MTATTTTEKKFGEYNDAIIIRKNNRGELAVYAAEGQPEKATRFTDAATAWAKAHAASKEAGLNLHKYSFYIKGDAEADIRRNGKIPAGYSCFMRLYWGKPQIVIAPAITIKKVEKEDFYL